MATHVLLLLAITLFGYGLLARKIDQADITAPMIFTLAGVLCGPLGLTWIHTDISDPAIMMIAEFTLVVVLFTDASQIRRKHLTQFERYPIRLLAIGLPLTIFCGTLAAFALFDLPWSLAVALAIILTPTDAALAQSIVDKTEINRNLRHSISVESGLNDGIALPLLLMVLALLKADGDVKLDSLYWAEYISLQLIFGTLSGIAIGRLGSYLINLASNSHWISPMYQRLSSISLAIIAYSSAEMLHGNGFIAVFLAGLLMQTKHKIVISRIKEFGEAEGQLLTLVVFFIFGAIFVPLAWQHISVNVVFYALLSLSLVRMIPVAISLLGTDLTAKEQLFLAWFGPRGIASILYLLLMLQQLNFQITRQAEQQIFATVVVTVLLSIIIHGASTSIWERSLATRHKEPDL